MSIMVAPDALEQVLDQIESAAWHVAAEPIPARMDALRETVRSLLEDTSQPASLRKPHIARRLSELRPVIQPKSVPVIETAPELQPEPEPEPEPALLSHRISDVDFDAIIASVTGPEPEESTGEKTKDCRGACKRQNLPISMFAKDYKMNKDGSQQGDGLRYRCRECETEARKIAREKKKNQAV
jgi:hypothetical protein